MVGFIEILDQQFAQQCADREHGADGGVQTLQFGRGDAGIQALAQHQRRWLFGERRWLGDHDVLGTGLGFVGEADGLRQDIGFHGELGLGSTFVVLVDAAVQCLHLRQDIAELVAFKAPEFGEVEQRQSVIGDPRNVARMVDDQHRHLREAAAEHLLQSGDVFRRGIVDEDDDVGAIRLESADGLDGGHEVGG
jgi:hypothetical protein